MYAKNTVKMQKQQKSASNLILFYFVRKEVMDGEFFCFVADFLIEFAKSYLFWLCWYCHEEHTYVIEIKVLFEQCHA